jgi:spoIIIJ-associated protein
MDDHLEEDGKDVEETIKKSLDKLGIPFEEEVTESEEGREVEKEPSGTLSGEETGIIKEALQTILSGMGFEAEIWVNRENDEYQANIRPKGFNGLLIGKKGETLLALQHVVRRLVQRSLPEVRLSIDVNNYRKKRDEKIVATAKELAESVKMRGEERSMESLNPYERWLVHTALEPDSGVVTHTEGEGIHKTVIITPVKK